MRRADAQIKVGRVEGSPGVGGVELVESDAEVARHSSGSVARFPHSPGVALKGDM
jgi:hypothetical protein